MNTPDDAEYKALLREFTPLDPIAGPTYADVERAIEKYILSRLTSPTVAGNTPSDAVLWEREECASVAYNKIRDIGFLGDEVTAKAVCDAIRARGTAVESAAVPTTRLLAKHQPCGCVICTCGDPDRCHGCGAQNCGKHPPGLFPSTVYAAPTEDAGKDDLPGMLSLSVAVQRGEWPFTMDASLWAEKFAEAVAADPSMTSDRGAMIGWFANAIMAGYDCAWMKRTGVVDDWRKAVAKLVMMARTSGGTAGRDEALCSACDEVEKLLAAAPVPKETT